MKKAILIIFILILTTGCSSQVASDKNKTCNTKEDCVQVGCGCDPCEDIVNKEYKQGWYHERKCPATECLCSPVNFDCIEGQCVILE